MTCDLESCYYELYLIDEENLQCLTHWKVKVEYRFIYAKKAHLFYDLHNVYVVKTIITINENASMNMYV